MEITHDNEAVSPVIGVILMVAITVIIAAVVAAFVFGIAGNITKTKVVGATAERTDNLHIYVTYQGGQDSATLKKVKWTLSPETGSSSSIIMSAPLVNSALKVGTTKMVLNPNFGSRTHIVATASFSDGSDQVILDNTI